MFPLVVLSCLLVSAIAGPTLPTPEPRIVKGEPVNIEDYPYQLSLEFDGKARCGASIISKNWAITAAHCTYHASGLQLSVRAGSSFRESGGQVVNVEKYHQHPDFNYATKDYDYAVLKLASDLDFGPGVAAIDLAVGKPIPVGEKAVVSGWGKLSEGGSAPLQLQAAHVTIINNDDCALAYTKARPPFTITDHMMCAGGESSGQGFCNGDSGGPLVVNNLLYGIVSVSTGCARDAFPGVYASIPNIRTFIKNFTGI